MERLPEKNIPKTNGFDRLVDQIERLNYKLNFFGNNTHKKNSGFKVKVTQRSWNFYHRKSTENDDPLPHFKGGGRFWRKLTLSFHINLLPDY